MKGATSVDWCLPKNVLVVANCQLVAQTMYARRKNVDSATTLDHFPTGSLLLTLDVSSLCTDIPVSEGINFLVFYSFHQQ